MDKMNNQEPNLTESISDKEVITRVLQGEKNLYSIIVRRYNQRLYRVAMGIIDDDAEVEDIMQVAYIKAYENLGQFGFKSAFSTWLTKILINESLLRLKNRKKSLHLANADTGYNEMFQQQIMDAQTPLHQVLNTELRSVLEKAICELPEKYRAVFVMREVERMSIAETQACLDITAINVKVRLNRAKALLRNRLNDYCKKEDLLHFHLSRCDRMVDSVMKAIEKM